MQKNQTIIIIVALSMISTSILIMFQQLVIWGNPWEWDDFLHHENFAAILLASSFTLTLIVLLLRKRAK